MESVSVIIATRNRAGDLRKTLNSLAQVQVPSTLEVEFLLVDNGSTDDTKQVALAFDAPRLPLHYLSEPHPGKARALNTALRQARGDVLLFTDDDVRVPGDWIAGMSTPILCGEADAVAGGVVLAPHLRGPRLKHEEDFLASTANVDPDRPSRMVGANMAFSKSVREKVPWFDPELGPGALGLEEETFFSLQLLEAGYTITSAFDTVVEHHFDPARLTRAAHRKHVERLGRSMGYEAYHWHHVPSRHLRVCASIALKWMNLRREDVSRMIEARQGENLSEREYELLSWFYYKRQFLQESRRPRNYRKHGLIKQRGILPQPAPSSTPVSEADRVS